MRSITLFSLILLLGLLACAQAFPESALPDSFAYYHMSLTPDILKARYETLTLHDLRGREFTLSLTPYPYTGAPTGQRTASGEIVFGPRIAFVDAWQAAASAYCAQSGLTLAEAAGLPIYYTHLMPNAGTGSYEGAYWQIGLITSTLPLRSLQYSVDATKGSVLDVYPCSCYDPVLCVTSGVQTCRLRDAGHCADLLSQCVRLPGKPDGEIAALCGLLFEGSIPGEMIFQSLTDPFPDDTAAALILLGGETSLLIHLTCKTESGVVTLSLPCQGWPARALAEAEEIILLLTVP